MWIFKFFRLTDLMPNSPEKRAYLLLANGSLTAPYKRKSNLLKTFYKTLITAFD